MIPTIEEMEKAELKLVLNQFGEEVCDDRKKEEESYADLGIDGME